MITHRKLEAAIFLSFSWAFSWNLNVFHWFDEGLKITTQVTLFLNFRQKSGFLTQLKITQSTPQQSARKDKDFVHLRCLFSKLLTHNVLTNGLGDFQFCWKNSFSDQNWETTTQLLNQIFWIIFWFLEKAQEKWSKLAVST